MCLKLNFFENYIFFYTHSWLWSFRRKKKRMNSFKRNWCFWLHNAPKLWFSDSFSRRILILKFKVSKRCSVKQWEICCYIKDKAEGDISWLCLNLSSRESRFLFVVFWLSRIALVLLKNKLIEAISGEGLQSMQS